MGIFGEDDLQRGVYGAVTQAVGANAAIDLDRDRNVNPTITPPNILSEAEALEYTNPTYDDQALKWQKYLNLYEGKDVYEYIHRHLREDDATWKKRVERGYFYNYVEDVVDTFTAFLFHAPIDRNPGTLAEDFEEIYKDADFNGTLWDVFWQEACTYAQVEGHVGILVDMPETPVEEFDTEADRKEANFRPYLTLLHAKQILDWELDDYGNFKWVKVEIVRPDEERDWKQPVEEEVRNFVIWDREKFEEWKLVKRNPSVTPPDDPTSSVGETAFLVRSQEHGLGVVPLVILRMQKQADHPWFGVSSVRDISDINIAILNWSSLGDEEIFERCLNVLAMERGEGDAPAQLSHGNVLEYEPGGNKPEYLVPGETALKLIQEWMKEARDEIRRLAKVRPSGGLGDVRQASSGIAHAFQFLETNQSLAAKALGLQQAETRVHRMIARWMGERFDGTITYPSEFGVEDELMLFQGMTLARGSLTSETAIKELEKKVARKLFASDSTMLRQVIEQEIEDAEQDASLESIFQTRPPGGTTPPQPEPEGTEASAPDEDSGTATGADPGEVTAA